jgi:hypothetical protein
MTIVIVKGIQLPQYSYLECEALPIKYYIGNQETVLGRVINGKNQLNPTNTLTRRRKHSNPI